MKKCFLNWFFRVACLCLSISLVYADGNAAHVAADESVNASKKRNKQLLKIASANVMDVDGSLKVTVNKRYKEDASLLSYSIIDIDTGAAFVDAEGLLVAISSGMILLTATSAGDANYLPASTSQLITIRKGKPKLSVASSNKVTVADSLHVTVNSPTTYERGGAVNFKIVDAGSGSATIDPHTGLLVAKAAGQITVMATSSGDSDYESSNVLHVVEIAQRKPSLKIIVNDTCTVGNVISAVVRTTAAPGRGGAVRFSIVPGSGAATVNPYTGMITPLGVGSITLVASTFGDVNYTPTAAHQEIIIHPATPQLTLELNRRLDVDATVSAVVKTSAVKGGGAVHYAITAGTGNAEVDANTGSVKGLKVGTIILTATTAGDKNYYASSISKTFTIGQNTPILSIESATRLGVGDTLSAKVKSTAGEGGGAIRYSILGGSGLATVDADSGVLTALGVGNMLLVASSAGDLNYAPSVTMQEIFIDKGQPSIAVVPSGTLRVDEHITATVNTAATNGYSGPVKFSIIQGSGYAEVDPNTGVVRGIRAGTVELVATSEGDDNYKTTNISHVLAIDKNIPVLTILSANKTRVGEAFRVAFKSTAPSGFGGPVSISLVSSGSGSATIDPYTGMLTALKAGVVTLIVSSPGDSNYAAAMAKQEITISIGIPKLTIEIYNTLEVDGQSLVAVTSSARGGRGGAIHFSMGLGEGDGYATVDPETGVINAITAGKVLLIVRAAGDSDYQAVTQTYWLTIAQRMPELTMALSEELSVDKTVMAYVFSSATDGMGGAITYAVTAGSGSATVDPSTGALMGISAGTVKLTASTEGDWDYKAASISQEITIDKGRPVLSLSPVMGLRVDEIATLTATTTAQKGGGLIRFSVDKEVSDGYAEIDEQEGQIAGITAGMILLNATAQGDANYHAVSISQWINIGKTTPTLTMLSPDTLQVDESFQLRLGTSATSGMGGSISFFLASSGSGSATLDLRTGWFTALSAGTVTIVVQSSGDHDYAPASVTQDITITEGNPVLMIVSDNTVAVDGQLAIKVIKDTSKDIGAFSYTIVRGDGAASVDAHGVITGIATGAVTLVVHSLGNANYRPSVATKSIAIKAHTPVLTIDSSDTLTVGEKLQVAVHTTARDGEGGNVSFSIKGGSGSATIDPHTGLLTAMGVGVVTVNVRSLGNLLYQSATASQDIHIQRAHQVLTIVSRDTVAVDSALEFLAQSNAAAGGEIKYSIVKAGGSGIMSNHRNKSTFKATHQGMVVLTASTAGNAHYAPAKASQIIVISKAKPLLTLLSPDKIAVGGRLVAVAKSNATYRRGGALRYTIEAGSGSATVDVNSGVVTALRAGEITLIAQTSGDDHYDEASVRQVVTIEQGMLATDSAFDDLLAKRDGYVAIDVSGQVDKAHRVQFIHSSLLMGGSNQDIRIPQAYSPNGDGINDLFKIENIKNYPHNSLLIASEQGKMVFEAAGYNNETVAFTGKSTEGVALQEGQYFYRLEYQHNGAQKVQKGFFKLAR